MDVVSTGPPTEGTCALRGAGVDWDAIRVPRVLGLTALCILGRRSGAVIDDGSALYWFLSPGVGADWDGESAQLLTLGSAVYVPPARRTQGPGPFWRICPGDATWHTDPAALLAAIEDALDANHRTSGTGRVAQ